MIGACLNHHQTASHTETLNQKLNLANLSSGVKTISDSCPGSLYAWKPLWHSRRLSFMATMKGVLVKPGSHDDCSDGGLSERAVWQHCTVKAPALSIMEQLFGARRTRALEHRVNRGEEHCKQRRDDGSYFPATVKGGKHPREWGRGVVDTGMHKHQSTRCGKKRGLFSYSPWALCFYFDGMNNCKSWEESNLITSDWICGFFMRQFPAVWHLTKAVTSPIFVVSLEYLTNL